MAKSLWNFAIISAHYNIFLYFQVFFLVLVDNFLYQVLVNILEFKIDIPHKI